MTNDVNKTMRTVFNGKSKIAYVTNNIKFDRAENGERRAGSILSPSLFFVDFTEKEREKDREQKQYINHLNHFM